MKWLKKLFGREAENIGSVNPQRASNAGQNPGPATVFANQEAVRITTEHVREYCAKLEHEGRRVGNARMIQQARNIRARTGITS